MKESDLLWWAGVTHADGYVYRKNNRVREIRLRVSRPSIEMARKWKRIPDSLTKKRHRLLTERMYDPRYERRFEQYPVREGSFRTINELVKLFEKNKIDILHFKPPAMALGRQERTAAYLAGIIDGDGCIQKRKRYDSQGIETLIKIVNNQRRPLRTLQRLLKALDLPSGYITDYCGHHDLWIYVSKKMRQWCVKHLTKHLSIERKALRLMLPRY